MFDIGFWELVLISVVGLVVLGPERLPHAIRSVSRFVSSAKKMANNVKDEISHELKVQELQENLRKAEKMGMEDLSPELKSSVDELKQAAQDVQRPYSKTREVMTEDGDTEEVENIRTSDAKEPHSHDHLSGESLPLADKKIE
ncbi:Sec-independent protein translocase protein TatB [Vibrio hepatarius]|uniref:Sec-independent protein translocase protein TatB n=1 Tax=Vibrio hepatarius TaxID=171383 RepID=UPI001C0A6277|nr:Sec-independent protein translocase protein TatB [Vibrio hepatarius]